MNKIIFFELNEVPLRIIDYYREIRPDSWIAQNYSRFNKYETFSENEGHLSPWNTWPTLHRGVPNSKHYIADFNQDLSEVDAEFAPIWKLLSDNGIRTGVFGSLHTYPVPENTGNYDFYVPDVFAPNHECFPKDIELFQKINLNLSRRSARNVDKGLPMNDVLKAMLKIRSYGISAGTVGRVAKQLVDERVDSWKSVRRRTYQTVLSFDLFYKQLKKKRPEFVTFFTNHVASSMHRYWAALFPDEYEDLKYDKEWIKTYNNEILFTMDHTDRMLKKLAKFVDRNNDYKLAIASSMGQEAVESEPQEMQLFVTDYPKFMAMLGLNDPNSYQVLPAMIPQYNFRINEDVQTVFEERLASLTVNGQSLVFRKKDATFFSVDVGLVNLKNISIRVDDKDVALEDSGLDNLEVEDKSSSTAYHIPEGHLFTYHPSNTKSEQVDQQLLTCDVVPILMNNYGLKPKDYMNRVEFVKI